MIVAMETVVEQSQEEVINDALNESSDGMNPEQLLENLSPMLCVNGGIKSDEDVQDITELMKETDKLVGRCVYLNILKATENNELLEKFIESGGWEVLNDWLQDGKTSENGPFLKELLEVYDSMPVTVGLLKKTGCAKTIKSISKSGESKGLKTKAATLVDKWMQKIREKAPESSGRESDKSDRSKKKKKRKESSNKESSSNNQKEDKESAKSPEKDKVVEKVKEEDEASMDSNSSKSSDTKPTEPVKPKAKTVKHVPSKFRSTGLEEETILPAKKKGSGDKAVKRISGLTLKSSEPPEKRPRPTLASLNPTSTPSSSTSPREKGETKIKLIAPRPAPPIESSGFMDALNNTTHMPVRKKRRPSVNEKGLKTPTSPTSPNSKQPAVPSFYKDTMEANEDSTETDKDSKEENENGSENDVEMKDEENKEKEEETVTPVGTGMVRKKHKKKVSWVEEAYLCRFHYFEMNEDERVNVNKLRNTEEMQREDNKMEGQALKGMGRGSMSYDDGEWRRPSLIQGITPAVVAGCNSIEKDVQRQREQGVLQALYFSKDMIPDSGGEADPESVGHQDAVTIPLEDENGPADSGTPPPYPKPVLEPPPPKKPKAHQQSQQYSMSLPQNVASMLQTITQENDMKPSVNSNMSGAAALAHLDPQTQSLITTLLQERGGSLDGLSPDNIANLLKTIESQMTGYNAGDPNVHGNGPYGGGGGNFMMGGGGPGFMNGPGPMGPGGPGMGGPGGHMMGGPMMQGNDGPGMMGGPNRMGGPGMRFGGGPPGYMRGPPRGRGHNGPPRGMPPVCRNFASGNCRFGNSCKFLHPGINGPPL